MWHEADMLNPSYLVQQSLSAVNEYKCERSTPEPVVESPTAFVESLNFRSQSR
jgi:hypothetical protein